MNSLFIAFPLPKLINSQLERLCFGLPNVQWIEHGYFLLNFLSIGSVENTKQLDIQEILLKIQIAPFYLSLKNLGCFHTKKTHGIIWAGVSPSESLTALIKIITTQLNEILPHFKSIPPHVPLGRFSKLDEKRLFDYLKINYLFESQPFLIDSITFMKSRTTQDNRTFYQELSHFRLNPPLINCNKLRVIK